MADHPSKTRWEAENVVRVTVKINRNQNPDLYAALKASSTPGATARQLMQAGLEK